MEHVFYICAYLFLITFSSVFAMYMRLLNFKWDMSFVRILHPQKLSLKNDMRTQYAFFYKKISCAKYNQQKRMLFCFLFVSNVLSNSHTIVFCNKYSSPVFWYKFLIIWLSAVSIPIHSWYSVLSFLMKVNPEKTNAIYNVPISFLKMNSWKFLWNKSNHSSLLRTPSTGHGYKYSGQIPNLIVS